MADQRPPTYHPNPSRPTLRLPRGAWDTHCHVLGPQEKFPFAPARTYPPSDAPKEKLFALHALLGIEHSVIVQSAGHGFDNRVVEDALAAKRGAYRGVALLPTDVSDAELRRLDALGFCGVRFSYMPHLGKGEPIEEVIALSPRLRELGWHLQIHPLGTLLPDLAPWLRRSVVPVVIDHMARIDAALGLDQPGFRQLLDLMHDEKFLVKVSGCERISRQPWPHADAVPFARKLVAEFGDRTLWGSDWPHPNSSGPVPDDGRLVDLIAEFAPSGAQRQALLVDNPQRFYGVPQKPDHSARAPS
ncbi:MAG: amidohydrolase family protein [Xanthobacteraceae bacterium]